MIAKNILFVPDNPACTIPTPPKREHQPTTALGGVGMPAALALDEFGSEVVAAFGDFAYHVGSSLTQKAGWRDVDVRLILADDEYEKQGYGDPAQPWQSQKWRATVSAWSAYGRHLTGLPIDFQVQQQTRANAEHSGPRSCIGAVPLRVRQPRDLAAGVRYAADQLRGLGYATAVHSTANAMDAEADRLERENTHLGSTASAEVHPLPGEPDGYRGLEPCPFCGMEALPSLVASDPTATCSNKECFMHGQWMPSPNWNTRRNGIDATELIASHKALLDAIVDNCNRPQGEGEPTVKHDWVALFRRCDRAVQAVTAWQDSPSRETGGATAPHKAIPVATGVEADVCRDIAERQARGIAKYKTTVADNPLTLRQWLQHAYEEALDLAVYLKRTTETKGPKP